MTDPVLYRRAFAADLEPTGAGMLTGRFVPYDVPAWVADPTPDGGVDRYQEGFRSTAFTRQVQAAEAAPVTLRRITFVDQHEGGFGKVGYVLAMRSEPDGLHGDLRVLDPRVGTMVDDGITGLSVGFVVNRGGTMTDRGGVRWRTRCTLLHVALEAAGAYPGAELLARAAADDTAEADAAEARRAELERWLADQESKLAAFRARVSAG